MPLTYLITFSGGPPVLRHLSPLTNEWTQVIPSRGFVVFDPTRPHSLEAPQGAMSITLYSPLRTPDEHQQVQLRLLGFPMPRNQIAAIVARLRQPQADTPPVGRMASPARTLNHPPQNSRPPQVSVADDPCTSESEDVTSQSSHLHIITTTTSGNGYAPATPATPEWRSDRSPSHSGTVTTTELDQSPQDTPWAPTRPSNDGNELDGGAAGETDPDDISRAIQKARTITRMYDKRQLRVIFKMEPRTMRRVLQASNSEEDKIRNAQMLTAAGKRLTLTPLGHTDPKHTSQAVNVHTKETGQAGEGKTDRRVGKGRGHNTTPNPKTSEAHAGRTEKQGKKLGAQTAPQLVTKTFALLPEEWTLPLRELASEPPYLNAEEDGIFMTESEEVAKAVAYEAGKSTKKIGLVTPSAFQSLAQNPKQTVVTLLSETLTDKGGTRTRSCTRCRTPVSIYNVSQAEAFSGEILPTIRIQDDQRMTTVIRLQYETSQIPAQNLRDNLQQTIRDELAPLLPAQGLIDL